MENSFNQQEGRRKVCETSLCWLFSYTLLSVRRGLTSRTLRISGTVSFDSASAHAVVGLKKSPAPPCQPINFKTKSNCSLAIRVFARLE